MPSSHYFEASFASALELIAMGEEREATRDIVLNQRPALSVDQVNDIIEDALRDALKQGIERDDIDPSWF